jgi:NAD(P)-dependent dehydrogenase (short-subunit alcohol dehydrogenase family)
VNPATLRFDHDVAIVTGGGRGMGRAHGLALAERGAQVVVVDIDQPAAQTVADEISTLGGAALALGVTDDPGRYQAVVDRVIEHWGQIDVVINNAGIAHDLDFGSETDGNLERMLDVHLRAPVRLVSSAWPELVLRRGRVVNIVSNAALFGKAGMTTYAASKGALVGWTRALALEGVEVGVRVNAVAPIASTRLTAGILGDLDERLAPERVTPVVLWLAHRDCNESGSVISSAGGVVARVIAARVTAGVAPTPEEVRGLLAAEVDISSATCPRSAADEVNDIRADLART